MPSWTVRFIAFLFVFLSLLSGWLLSGVLISPLPSLESQVVTNTEYLRGLKEARLRERVAAIEARYDLSIKLQCGALAVLVGIAVPVWMAALKLRDDRRKVSNAVETFGLLEVAVKDGTEQVRVLTRLVSQLYCVREGRCLDQVDG